MSRSLWLLAALVIGVGGAAGCSSASKTTSTPRSQATKPSVRMITVKAVEHDVSIKRSGATVTVVNNLMSGGKKIGEGQVVCFLSGRGAAAMCLGAASLPEGQILSQASLPLPPVGTNVDAIVGGTGAYATARGTIDLVRATATADTSVTFHVLVDS